MFNTSNLITNDTFLGTNAELPEFDYNSFYRAYVESISDPEGLGRIKVRIPTLHGTNTDGTPSSSLPYAYPACFTGLRNQVGPFYLPPVGSIVFVTFEFSDEHRIIYFGGIPTQPYDGKTQFYGSAINQGLPKDVTTADIPLEYTGSQEIIYKSPNGNIIYMDDGSANRVVIKDASGKYLEMFNYEAGNTKVSYYRNHISDNTEITLWDNRIDIKINGHTYQFDDEKISRLYDMLSN